MRPYINPCTQMHTMSSTTHVLRSSGMHVNGGSTQLGARTPKR